METQFAISRGTRAIAAVFALGCSLGASHALAQACGGTERWAVKVGTDSAARSIDQTSKPLAIADLFGMMPPAPPKTNTARFPTEKTVYKTTAYLIEWKEEGDSDFHLVLTDPTFKYTEGENASGHSFIGEIPDPDCYAGKHDGPTASAFNAGIRKARQQLLAMFPNADVKEWTNAQHLRVDVTGVAFFDTKHGTPQVGHAAGNFEFHPILDIHRAGGSDSK